MRHFRLQPVGPPPCAVNVTAGRPVKVLYHSHLDVGAYFSEKDRADAVLDGVQAVPGAEYLVLGVRRGRVTEVKRYRLEGGAFVEAGLG